MAVGRLGSPERCIIGIIRSVHARRSMHRWRVGRTRRGRGGTLVVWAWARSLARRRRRPSEHRTYRHAAARAAGPRQGIEGGQLATAWEVGRRSDRAGWWTRRWESIRAPAIMAVGGRLADLRWRVGRRHAAIQRTRRGNGRSALVSRMAGWRMVALFGRVLLSRWWVVRGRVGDLARMELGVGRARGGWMRCRGVRKRRRRCRGWEWRATVR